METPKEKTLRDLRWVAIDGQWDKEGPDGLVYTGGEYDPPISPTIDGKDLKQSEQTPPDKYIQFGTILFDQHFKEGRCRMQVEFDEVDNRCLASLVIQYNPSNKDMLTFGITGGGRKWRPGDCGFLFRLAEWSTPANEQQQGTSATSSTPAKKWTPFFETGLGVNIRAKHPYDLEVFVRGAVITIYVDGVEIGKQTLPFPSLAGNPIGIFCGTHKKIHFRNISVTSATPTAFVVMQFQTPEYEALFKDVIEPICKSEGLHAFRADSTYMPGLVVEDIKRQIAESLVVIAEITPTNANVYYEVGYADALNKPLILIADRKEGLKPFDVRAYRTIFYENSIGGKNAVENDLRAYLRNIMKKP